MAGSGHLRIIITGFNRPGYMRETIEHWSRVRGIQDALVEFHLEPGRSDVVSICEESPFPHEVYVAREHQGVQRNPWKAASHAFESSDFVILAEDDMVVGADILEYFRWAEEKYRHDQGVLAITAAHRDQASDPPEPAACTLIGFGQFWVWGIWRDRWDLIGPDWRFAYEHNGWDYRLSEYWCQERGMKMLSPNLSRVQHIGREGGSHCTPHMFEGLLSPCFVQDAEAQQYYTVNEA